MDPWHKKVMALSGVLECRRSHEVALDHEAMTVCQTRVEVVFGRLASHEDFAALSRQVFSLVMAEPVAAGFVRHPVAWPDADLYGKPSVVVQYVDVEAPHGACGTEAA